MVLKVRLRGSPSSVGVLAALLRDEGLQVEHRGIVEQHDTRHDIVDVVFYVDDPDVDEALITAKIETAIVKLRASAPRAQAQMVATNRSPHTSLSK
jgi:hypothetical protein